MVDSFRDYQIFVKVDENIYAWVCCQCQKPGSQMHAQKISTECFAGQYSVACEWGVRGSKCWWFEYQIIEGFEIVGAQVQLMCLMEGIWHLKRSMETIVVMPNSQKKGFK